MVGVMTQAQSNLEIQEFTQTMDGFIGSKDDVLPHVNSITLSIKVGVVITRSYRTIIHTGLLAKWAAS